MVLFWTAAGLQSVAAAPLVVSGGGRVAIDAERIQLGQIAQVSGGDAQLRRTLEQVTFGPAPRPGKSKTIDAEAITRWLKGHQIDMANLQLQITSPIEVTRRSVSIKADKIKKAVIQFLHQKMPWEPKTAKIKAIRGLANFKVPAGKLRLTVAAPPGCKYLGSEPLSVSIFVSGELYKKIWVTADIEVRSQVVMVAKPLGRYQPIRADQLKLVEVDLAEVPSQAIRRMDEAVGMRAKRRMYPKTILRRDYVEAPYVVQRGDLVKIVARSEVLQLTAQGITKERGRRGERIRVENVDSKKQIYATVVNASTVEVQF
jgi:flagella basal body P-ring formation protein FlgA